MHVPIGMEIIHAHYDVIKGRGGVSRQNNVYPGPPPTSVVVLYRRSFNGPGLHQQEVDISTFDYRRKSVFYWLRSFAYVLSE